MFLHIGKFRNRLPTRASRSSVLYYDNKSSLAPRVYSTYVTKTLLYLGQHTRKNQAIIEGLILYSFILEIGFCCHTVPYSAALLFLDNAHFIDNRLVIGPLQERQCSWQPLFICKCSRRNLDLSTKVPRGERGSTQFFRVTELLLGFATCYNDL